MCFPETRKAGLDSVSDNHRNPLVEFAARNSTAKTSLDNNKPLYLLGEKIMATSPATRSEPCNAAARFRSRWGM